MKNVMVRAWEIAKAGAAKFGGKVKEYLAQALRMAWAEIKKGVKVVENNKFGFIEHAKKQGVLYFLVDDMDGMVVSMLNERFNGMNRTTYVGRKEMSYKAGLNKELNKQMRFYSITLDNLGVEIKVGDKVASFKLNRGQLEWF